MLGSNMTPIVGNSTLQTAVTWPEWRSAFGNERKDARFYEIIDRTLDNPFEFRYLLLENADGGRAVQPYFVLDQDVTEGAGAIIHSIVNAIRKVVPRFLTMRTLMVGCAAGEGHLAADWVGTALARELPQVARQWRASLIVMKEFPSRERHLLADFASAEFTRVPSMPMTRLDIDFADFDDYVAKKLSKVSRKNVRRKLRAAEAVQPPLTLEVLTDVTPIVDELYPLYLAVYNRSKLHFEKLSKELLIELGRKMPDKVRFFVWRLSGKAVAFSICMIHGNAIYDEYLGLDYEVAFERHLYFTTLRDIINWAIAHGLQRYVSSALNYEPKLHLRCELAPLDLYVRHTSRVINAFMKRLLPLLEPTRNDPILKRFPNFAEVWDR